MRTLTFNCLCWQSNQLFRSNSFSIPLLFFNSIPADDIIFCLSCSTQHGFLNNSDGCGTRKTKRKYFLDWKNKVFFIVYFIFLCSFFFFVLLLFKYFFFLSFIRSIFFFLSFSSFRSFLSLISSFVYDIFLFFFSVYLFFSFYIRPFVRFNHLSFLNKRHTQDI